jgi:hypothetical protein
MFWRAVPRALPCYFGAGLALVNSSLSFLLASKFAMNASIFFETVSPFPPKSSICDLMFGLRSVTDPLGARVVLAFLTRALLGSAARTSSSRAKSEVVDIFYVYSKSNYQNVKLISAIF